MLGSAVGSGVPVNNTRPPSRQKPIGRQIPAAWPRQPGSANLEHHNTPIRLKLLVFFINSDIIKLIFVPPVLIVVGIITYDKRQKI